MKKFGIVLMSFLFVAPVWAEENLPQEYYDQQMAENMQELTSQVQQMSDTLVKYMTALNKVLGESLPQMNENLVKVMSSMQPIAQTMQQNIEEFEKQLDAQPDFQNLQNNTQFIAPESVVVPEIQMENTDISRAIDEELAQFEVNHPVDLKPAKIKLFPSSVE